MLGMKSLPELVKNISNIKHLKYRNRIAGSGRHPQDLRYVGAFVKSKRSIVFVDGTEKTCNRILFSELAKLFPHLECDSKSWDDEQNRKLEETLKNKF